MGIGLLGAVMALSSGIAGAVQEHKIGKEQKKANKELLAMANEKTGQNVIQENIKTAEEQKKISAAEKTMMKQKEEEKKAQASKGMQGNILGSKTTYA